MPRRGHDAPGPRPLRVGEELRHALAHIFEQGRLHDPALAGLALTVTEVRVSPDLKNATAYVMPLAGAHAGEAMEALKRASGFLRRELAQAVKLRVVPTIGFEILDNQQKLNLGESKLKSAHKTARRTYTIFSRVDRAALSESDQSRLIHEEHKAASTIACGQIKRTAPKPIL